MTMDETEATTIQIDDEIRDLVRPLNEEEARLLEESIDKYGCRDPLVVWAEEDILLDGHNRKKICDAKGISYEVNRISHETRGDAINWVISNQLARRNLSPNESSYLRGKRYEAEKKEEGGRADRDLSGDQTEHPKTAERLAPELGVSAPTIRRDAVFAEAVDKLAEDQGQEVKTEILSPRFKGSKKAVVEAAKLPKEEQRAALGKKPERQVIAREDGAALDQEAEAKRITKLCADVARDFKAAERRLVNAIEEISRFSGAYGNDAGVELSWSMNPILKVTERVRTMYMSCEPVHDGSEVDIPLPNTAKELLGRLEAIQKEPKARMRSAFEMITADEDRLAKLRQDRDWPGLEKFGKGLGVKFPRKKE